MLRGISPSFGIRTGVIPPSKRTKYLVQAPRNVCRGRHDAVFGFRGSLRVLITTTDPYFHLSTHPQKSLQLLPDIFSRYHHYHIFFSEFSFRSPVTWFPGMYKSRVIVPALPCTGPSASNPGQSPPIWPRLGKGGRWGISVVRSFSLFGSFIGRSFRSLGSSSRRVRLHPAHLLSFQVQSIGPWFFNPMPFLPPNPFPIFQYH